MTTWEHILDCVFCEIIKGNIPCEKVYEDEKVFAFLSNNPVKPGHTLVVPKVHVRNILDCPPDILSDVMTGVKKISEKLTKDGAKAIQIVQNNEKPLQEVFHLHFHVIPYMT